MLFLFVLLYSETFIKRTPSILLSGQKPKYPNLFPLFTLNETFIKRTQTPKKYLKWSFLLLPSCIRTLEIKLHQPTGARHQKCARLPRIITPKFFDFYIKKGDLTNFFDQFHSTGLFSISFCLYRACFTHLISSNLSCNLYLWCYDQLVHFDKQIKANVYRHSLWEYS